ncbi:Hypothetical_protein [Hexamita inflata]|uniref:Hypothetical_protein n=1 Tax=Hexamita inflata TaxID=28002 RepID=A0AA86NRT1_9EUKA|nr:Hypothetical protein HINF_LOCUS11783 [Hexamita inflata]
MRPVTQNRIDINDMQNTFRFPRVNVYVTIKRQNLILFDENLLIISEIKLQSDLYYKNNNQDVKIIVFNGQIFVQCENRLYKLNLNCLEFVTSTEGQIFAFNGSLFTHNNQLLKFVNNQFQFQMRVNGTIFSFCDTLYVFNRQVGAIFQMNGDFSLTFVHRVEKQQYVKQTSGMLLITQNNYFTAYSGNIKVIIQMHNRKIVNVDKEFYIDEEELVFNEMVTFNSEEFQKITSKINIQEINQHYKQYSDKQTTLSELLPLENTNQQISEQDVINCYKKNTKLNYVVPQLNTNKYTFHDLTITAQINLKNSLYFAIIQSQVAVIDQYQNILDQSANVQLESNFNKILQNQTICCGTTYFCINSNIYSLISSKLELVAIVPDCTALFSMNDKLYAHSHNYVQLIKNGKPHRIVKVNGQIFQFCESIFVFDYYRKAVYELDSIFQHKQIVFDTKYCQRVTFHGLGYIAISQSGSKRVAVVDLLAKSGKIHHSRPQFHENNILTNCKLGLGGFVPDQRLVDNLQLHQQAYAAYILEQERRFPLQVQRTLQKGKLPQYLMLSVKQQLGHNLQRIESIEHSAQILKRNTTKSLNRMQILTNKITGKLASVFTKEIASNQSKNAAMLNQLFTLHEHTFTFRLNKLVTRLNRLQAAVQKNAVLKEVMMRFETVCILYNGLTFNEVTQ